MRRLGRPFACYFQVNCIRTNLDFVRPSNLSVLPEVNDSEHGGINERREHSISNIPRKVNCSINSVRINNVKLVMRQRLHLDWAYH